MPNLRTLTIPFEHMLTELAAFPLASEASFHIGCVELDPSMRGATHRLWREAERRMVRFPNLPLDELSALTDSLWFAKGISKPISLVEYLRWLADKCLQWDGAVARPHFDFEFLGRGEPEDGQTRGVRARMFWRWLTFALPSDLLLAALARGLDLPSEVELLPPTLDALLTDTGYAETHQHVNGGVDFRLLWLGALLSAGKTDQTETAYASPGAELDEGKDFAGWILRAAITRYVLAAHLKTQATAGTANDFSKFFREMVEPRVSARAGAAAAVRLRLALMELASARRLTHLSHADVRDTYVSLSGVRSARPSKHSLRDAHDMDPIAPFFPQTRDGRITPEMRFLAAALDYLADSGKKDREFARLFWQYVRVRNLLYRHFVQRPMTPGLQWFLRTYDRLKPARAGLGDALIIESSAMITGLGRGLTSFEGRFQPEKSAFEMRRIVGTYVKTLQRASLRLAALGSSDRGAGDTAALVLHFVRDRQGGVLKGAPRARWSDTGADPRLGYRYASHYRENRRRAMALGSMLLAFPRTLEVVRGIDLCTDEVGVPTWVFTPLFSYLRNVGHVVSHYLQRAHGRNVPPLRTTLHTGEDFVHLLSGLRRLGDSILRLDLKEGDRIGHGTALGIDARAWASRTGPLVMNREARLLDLVWERQWYVRHRVSVRGSRTVYLEDEIVRLGHVIFGDRVEPRDIVELVEDVYNEREMRAVYFPGGPRPPSEPGETPRGKRRNRLVRYLTDPGVFARGHEPEWVDAAPEGDILDEIQSGLRAMVGRMGLTVEVNPSSNLLIGNFGDLTHHPFWRLQSPLDGAPGPPVTLCVGSDDPMTFATNLREEYLLLHDTLLSAGLSEASTLRWLEQLCRQGRRATFTLPHGTERERVSKDWTLGLDARVPLPP